MKTKISNTIGKGLMAVWLICIGISCEEINPAGPTEAELKEFTDQLNGLDEFVQPEELSTPVKVSEEEPARDAEDPTLECYSTYYKAAPGFDEMLALDPTTDVIFPGAILKGESVPTGEYLPIVANRAPITLSASLQNISGSPVVTIDKPALSSVRAGIKQILDHDITGATPASLNYEIVDVYSQEQLKLALGINYRSVGTKVSSSFDFSNTTIKNRFVLKYIQVYYTIDMDLPSEAGELFTTLPDISSLGSTSPVYVSTVTYGRMILYTIESSYSKTDIKGAFEASFDESGGSFSAKHQKILDESNIKALVIGGSGEGAAQTITGPEEVYNYIAEGGNYSKDSPGAPLSYKLRYLKDNSVARVVLSSEYAIRTCNLAMPTFRITLKRITCIKCEDGDGSKSEIHGRIWAYVRKNSTRVGERLDWSRSTSQYVRLKNGEYTDIGGASIKTVLPELDLYDYNVLMGGKLEEDDTDKNEFWTNDPGETFSLRGMKPSDSKTEYVNFEGAVVANFFIERLK